MRNYKYVIISGHINFNGWVSANDERITSRHNSILAAIKRRDKTNRECKKYNGQNTWRDQQILSWDEEDQTYRALGEKDAEVDFLS